MLWTIQDSKRRADCRKSSQEPDLPVPSDDVFEKVVDFFFGTNPILSSSLDWFRFCDEGFLNKPFTDARGFKGRADRVLLPDLIFGTFAVLLTGLGERCRREALKLGDGTFVEDEGAVPRIEDGVFSALVSGRFSGA
jgi:hypothetical protein